MWNSNLILLQTSIVSSSVLSDRWSEIEEQTFIILLFSDKAGIVVKRLELVTNHTAIDELFPAPNPPTNSSISTKTMGNHYFQELLYYYHMLSDYKQQMLNNILIPESPSLFCMYVCTYIYMNC